MKIGHATTPLWKTRDNSPSAEETEHGRRRLVTRTVPFLLLSVSLTFAIALTLSSPTSAAQAVAPPAGAAIVPVVQTRGSFVDKFRQLDEVWPTANAYRNAAGEPGHAYWQQEASYQIEVALEALKRALGLKGDSRDVGSDQQGS